MIPLYGRIIVKFRKDKLKQVLLVQLMLFISVASHLQGRKFFSVTIYCWDFNLCSVFSLESLFFSHHRSMRLKIKKRRVGWLIRKCTSLTRKWNRKPGLCRANWKNLLRKPSKLLYLTTDNLRFHLKIAILTKCYYVLNNCYNLIKGAKCLRNCGAASVGEYNKIILVLSTEFQSWCFKHQPFVRVNEEVLMLEMSVLKLFTVANLHLSTQSIITICHKTPSTFKPSYMWRSIGLSNIVLNYVCFSQYAVYLSYMNVVNGLVCQRVLSMNSVLDHQAAKLEGLVFNSWRGTQTISLFHTHDKRDWQQS